jgi:hypothetical protein
MRATNRFSKISTVVAVALALSAAGCGKKKAKPTGAAGSAAGSTEGSTAGSAGSNAGSAKPAPVIRSVTPQEAVDAPDRPADDKALDAGRKPVEMLTFLHVTAA